MGAALVLTTAAYLALRDGDDRRPLETARADEATTTTQAPTSTSAVAPTTTTTTVADSSSSTTTVTSPPAPSSTTAAPPGTTTTAAALTARTAPPPTAPPPPFQSSIETVTAEQLGSSWRPGCPVGVEQLRAVSVSHWGYDGQVHTGHLVVAAARAAGVVAALRDVYDARFPIQQMVPVDRYGSDDGASMRANNTSAFNCRYVAGTTTWSEHSHGQAIDINPLVNPYVRGQSVDPPEGAVYADRSRTDAGMIKAEDVVVRAFAGQGWGWGGYWSTAKDYQHFSTSGR